MKLLLEEDDIIPYGRIGDDVLCAVKPRHRFVGAKYVLTPEVPPFEVELPDEAWMEARDIFFSTEVIEPFVPERISLPWGSNDVLFHQHSAMYAPLQEAIEVHYPVLERWRELCSVRPVIYVTILSGGGLDIAVSLYLKHPITIPRTPQHTLLSVAKYAERLYGYRRYIYRDKNFFHFQIRVPEELPPEAREIWEIPFLEDEERKKQLHSLRMAYRLTQLV